MGHEINNPLAFVTSNLAFALDSLTAEPSQDVALTEVVEALRDAKIGLVRIRDIVAGMKMLSRSGTQSGPVELAPVIRFAVSVLRNQIDRRARLELEQAETPPVEADETRLCQVVINLIQNALDAMAEVPGRDHVLSIRTSVDAQGWVHVEVADTGPGIPPEIRARLFEPFFTTKPVGKGTGLGLPISHSIVNEFGGTLDVETQVGAGATFRIRLPASDQRYSSIRASSAA